MLQYKFSFYQDLSRPSDRINLSQLSSSSKLPNIIWLFLHSSSTNFDKRPNRNLRSQNHALNATHLQHFINNYLSFILLVIHIKNNCQLSANFGESSNQFSFFSHKRISFWCNFLPILSFKKICQLFVKNPIILEENASQLLWTRKNGRIFYTIHEGWKWVHANWTNLPIKPRRHSDTLSHVRLRTVKLQWWTMTEPIRDPPDSPKRFSSGNNSYLWHQYAQTIFINHNWVTVERT